MWGRKAVRTDSSMAAKASVHRGTGVLVSHKSKCLGVPVRRGGQGGLAGQTAMVPLHPEQLLTYFFYVFETPSDCISKMDIIIKIKG